jgi:ABC-type nitrate/sulfonate/bicarbonate transport system ATPase subunit
MQQRAAIVRALALKPSVLLMDEPFGALDAFTREEMNRLVEEIWLETPTTIVFITHHRGGDLPLGPVVVLTPRPGRVPATYGCRSRGRARSRSWRPRGVRPRQPDQGRHLRAPQTATTAGAADEGAAMRADAIPSSFGPAT